MGKPRPKRVYSPELLENLRFRFEETAQPVRAIAATVPMGRTTLYALAEELGWTRFVPPPLDLTPAARLAAEAGQLAAEAGRLAASSLCLPPRSGEEGRFALRQQGEPGWGVACGIEKTAGGETSSPPTPDPSPPLAAPAGGGEENAAPPSAAQTGQAPDLSNLTPEERKARLSAMARAIDHQLALVRRRQALPQTEHERKEISIEVTNLNAALSQTEQQLQDLDRGHNVKSAIGDDGFPEDVDEAREELARRIDALVDEWLHEADAEGAAGVEGEAGA
jgi:hypothetical protein